MSSRDGAIVLGFLLLGGQSFLVNWRVQQLANRLEEAKFDRPGSPERTRAGHTLSGRLIGTAPTGEKVEVDFASPVLLVFISPTCGPCNRSLPELQAIERAAASNRRTYFISAASPRDIGAFRDKKKLLGEVLSVQPGWLTQNGLIATPMLLAVGVGGRVDDVWMGAPGPALASEIAKSFAPTS